MPSGHDGGARDRRNPDIVSVMRLITDRPETARRTISRPMSSRRIRIWRTSGRDPLGVSDSPSLRLSFLLP
eukprot:27208-Rhodomonas_salina.1